MIYLYFNFLFLSMASYEPNIQRLRDWSQLLEDQAAYQRSPKLYRSSTHPFWKLFTDNNLKYLKTSLSCKNSKGRICHELDVMNIPNTSLEYFIRVDS